LVRGTVLLLCGGELRMLGVRVHLAGHTPGTWPGAAIAGVPRAIPLQLVLPLPAVVVVRQPDERDPQPDDRRARQEHQAEDQRPVHLGEVDQQRVTLLVVRHVARIPLPDPDGRQPHPDQRPARDDRPAKRPHE